MDLQALPEEALKEILSLTEAKKRLDLRDEAQEHFMPFAHHVYENFIEGRHPDYCRKTRASGAR